MPVLATDPVTENIRFNDHFLVHRVGTSRESGLSYAKTLGDIVNTTEVRLRRDVDTYLCGHELILQHTDHPDVDLIVWHCHVNDTMGGMQILTDGWQAYLRLTSRQQNNLCQIALKCPRLHSRLHDCYRPLIDPATTQVFFAPWLLPDKLSSGQRDAVDAFVRISQYCKEVRHEIFLEPGEVLMVNNRRMLHGRAALPPSSNRWLTRYWVRRATASNPCARTARKGMFRAS